MTSSSGQRSIVALDEEGSVYTIHVPDYLYMTISCKEGTPSYIECMQELSCPKGLVLWVDKGLYEIWVTRKGRPHQIIVRSTDPYAP